MASVFLADEGQGVPSLFPGGSWKRLQFSLSYATSIHSFIFKPLFLWQDGVVVAGVYPSCLQARPWISSDRTLKTLLIVWQSQQRLYGSLKRGSIAASAHSCSAEMYGNESTPSHSGLISYNKIKNRKYLTCMQFKRFIHICFFLHNDMRQKKKKKTSSK